MRLICAIALVLTAKCGIGKALCIVGIIAIAVGVIDFFSGVGAMADASGYFDEVSKLSANIQLIGAAGSDWASLVVSARIKMLELCSRYNSSMLTSNLSTDLLNGRKSRLL